MKFRYNVKLLIILLFAGIFVGCASSKYPQKKRKKCNDCPKFSQELMENPSDKAKIYAYIG